VRWNKEQLHKDKKQFRKPLVPMSSPAAGTASSHPPPWHRPRSWSEKAVKMS
jgi:hypothetical protein